ncbi:MAG: hypothetical protein NUV74_16555 [Candidatus Brocadiaceae bacterium]|nr:hypothetical protein [Candidatus Brocadiaceae bacterium]
MTNWVVFILDKIVLALLFGVVTSAIFFLILSRFRPKIDISPKIAHGLSTKTGETIYRIKVINRTRSPLTDIKAQLHIYKNYQTGTGEIWKSDEIALKRSDPISIDRYDKNDADANYAFRFLTYNDLNITWNDDSVQFLRFRIFARHSVSGFGGFFLRDYRLKRNSIIDGDFSKGDTFEIV